MKKVYFKPPPASDHFRNGLFHIKSLNNTYFNIDKRLRKLNIDFNTIDFDKDGKGVFYIYADAPYPWEIKMWLKIITKRSQNILFSLESPLVNPFSQLPFIHLFFAKVFTWDDLIIDNKKIFKFYIQQTIYKKTIRKIPFKDKQFLTFMNNRKDVPWIFVLLSPYKENLYKKRFQILDFFSKKIPYEFEFFGKGWDKPIPWNIKEKIFGIKQYKSYKGEYKGDKIKKISNYKFCLCFENAIAPGYITEKIFDCFKAGCVPIYLGAPNISNYIDKNCFIDFRNFSNLEDLLDYLQNMKEKTYNDYLKQTARFMKQKKIKEVWFGDCFVKIINHLVDK